MLKPEDVDELKELQQSIKKSLDLFQQCVMFPPEDLHPQAELVIKKAEEYGYTVPEYVLEQAKSE